MMLFDDLADHSEAALGRVHGVVVGLVTNNQDPDGMGRVKVQFPWLSDTDDSNWARLAVPMAGGDRGVYFLPEVNDEVLVAFDHGDLRFPYVLGALWNGKDHPPASNDNGNNDVRLIKSRSGHVIRLTDSAGGGKIEIVDGSGNNSIVVDTSSNAITISAQGALKLKGAQIEIASDGPLKIKGATVDIN